MSSPVKSNPAPTAAPAGALNNAPRFIAGGDDREGERVNKLSPFNTQNHNHLPMPGLSGNPNGPVGNLLKGAVGNDGNLKDAALSVGIKLDLEAEVHLTARVRGDILVGLY